MRALHLDDDQRNYLSELAGKDVNRPRRRTRQTVQPSLRRVLDDLRSRRHSSWSAGWTSWRGTRWPRPW